MKLSVSATFGVVFQDILTGAFDNKYTISDDTYLLINNTLLVVDWLMLNAISKERTSFHNQYLNEILYDNAFETKESDMPQEPQIGVIEYSNYATSPSELISQKNIFTQSVTNNYQNKGMLIDEEKPSMTM